MRPSDGSLDGVAAPGQTAASSGTTTDPATQTQSSGGFVQASTAPTVVELACRDSRSSSSTNSPAPAEESDFYPVGNDSESSLGVVPNLQDMQVNDLECQPIAATLPSEILISIFSRLSTPGDLFKCMLVSKRWARNAVELLWHRPSCTSWEKHTKICQTLGLASPAFTYAEFIKRLNLATLAHSVNDGSVTPLSVCNRVERLTLANCKELTDTGLVALISNNPHLQALDISSDSKITERSMFAIANMCPRLQGLNISHCKNISSDSLAAMARSCRFIKRLKLNDCSQVNDTAVIAFAHNCPNMLEIDLHGCRSVGNAPVTALLAKGTTLRELRLATCDLIDDGAFLSLPQGRVYEHLRILDLTSCSRLTDRAVEKIIDVAPRLRNLVLAKCTNITDAAVYNISRLGKNLHYVHLGHCRNITDDAVKQLITACNRIRYIDLGCCSNLTDDSVMKLATLPKLKRIGLVKCSNITDESMIALARANHRRPRRVESGSGNAEWTTYSSLERVHLSYCMNLNLQSIIRLLNSCPKLTHLSLTGVPAFLRDDLDSFCRDAPADFTEHQRQVFCVFSGQGVSGLRKYLNSQEELDRTEAAVEQAQNDGASAAMQMAETDAFTIDDGDGDDDEIGDGSETAADGTTELQPTSPTFPGHATIPLPLFPGHTLFQEHQAYTGPLFSSVSSASRATQAPSATALNTVAAVTPPEQSTTAAASLDHIPNLADITSGVAMGATASGGATPAHGETNSAHTGHTAHGGAE